MQNDILINNIMQAMQAAGHTTQGTAAAQAIIAEEYSSWVNDLADRCVDEALVAVGEYSDCIRGDLFRWGLDVKRKVIEVAHNVVGVICRSLNLTVLSDDVCGQLRQTLYIDSYAVLKPIRQLSEQVEAANEDELIASPGQLSGEAQEVVARARRSLRKLFGELVIKLKKLTAEVTRKDALRLVDVVAWVDDLHRRKAELKELYAQSLPGELAQMMASKTYTKATAIDSLIDIQEELLDDNTFHHIYVEKGMDEKKFAIAVRRKSGSGMGEELDKFIGMMAKRECLEDARAALISEEQDASLSEECGARSEELLLTSTQQQAFDRAVEGNFLKPVGNGKYKLVGQKVSLAYFIGRLFCSDYVESKNGIRTWKAVEDFPTKAMTAMFGIDDLGTIRSARKNGAPPKDYRTIDEYIEG